MGGRCPRRFLPMASSSDLWFAHICGGRYAEWLGTSSSSVPQWSILPLRLTSPRLLLPLDARASPSLGPRHRQCPATFLSASPHGYRLDPAMFLSAHIPLPMLELGRGNVDTARLEHAEETGPSTLCSPSFGSTLLPRPFRSHLAGRVRGGEMRGLYAGPLCFYFFLEGFTCGPCLFFFAGKKCITHSKRPHRLAVK